MPNNIIQQGSTRLVMPQDLNPAGALFGGTLIGWMDQAAYMLAARYTQKNCVTAKFSEIEFKRPIRLGDIIKLTATFGRIGNTSMDITIEAHKINDTDQEPEFVASAQAVFVAVNSLGHPAPVRE